MTTGILTFHDGINYGAFCQVWSLQSYLLALGLDVRVINYKSRGFTDRERACFILPGDPEATKRNKQKMALFAGAHARLRLTQRMYEEEELKELHFERVVIGSDEVWNFSTELIGFDPVYFSRGLNADRVIAYAPSFGSVKAGATLPVEVRDNIKRLDAIAVRDHNSSTIIAEITGRPAPVVLDPTFLTDLSAEAVLPEDQDFILVYGFFTPAMITGIQTHAARTGLKTLAVGYRQPWCDESRDIVTPFEWLGYFQKCSCVVTTMFHGMIYSILNGKPFCLYVTDYRRNKLGNFLIDTGLAHLAVEETADLAGVFQAEVDYERVHAKLEEKRHFSKQYLQEALEI